MYYSNLDLTKITDSKKFWKTTKPFSSDKGAGTNGITLIEGDEIFHEESEVANILSDFFSNTVTNLNVSAPGEYKEEESAVSDDAIDNIITTYANHPSIKLINENVLKGYFCFKEVSLNAIEKEVTALDSQKAYMSSSIPTKILKKNNNVCCRPLAIIINKDISNSHFGNCLKLADLTPIHKADATTNKKHYRLPAVSKVLEKLSPFLCGYRKGYSAQHALLSMLEIWRGFVDKGAYGGGVLMDPSKDFDIIVHDLLIAKMHSDL